MQYFEPNFVEEALALLEQLGPSARVLAGGTLLGPEVRAASGAASAIVNIKRIPELHDIDFDGQTLHVGALATASELAANDLVRWHAPLLALAAASLGATQLRNVATIGGNLCSGHHAADLGAALLACDARCVIANLISGPTTMPVASFFRPHGHALEEGAILTAIEVPASAAKVSYMKMQTRRAFEMAIVAVGVAMTEESVRIALGGAAPTPVRASHAEKAWSLGRINSTAPDVPAREAGRIAAAKDCDPVTDHRATAEYRRHLVAVLTERALLDAAAAALGSKR
jgi:CO/xanthine dehydrogenase FAD-binding subunit